MEEGLNPNITVVAQYRKITDDSDKIVSTKDDREDSTANGKM